MPRHQPLSLEKLKEMRPPLRQVNDEHYQRLTPTERLAMMITRRVGAMGFFFIILAWTVLWLGWNVLVPVNLRFDPFPGFVLWLFISNMIQLFLLPLLMVGQNLQGRYSETRAAADFEINRKAEREIEAIIQHLENQEELLIRLESKK